MNIPIMKKLSVLIALAVAAGVALPAFADERGWREHEWREREHARHERWERRHERPYATYAPGFVYAPPPVYYAPPPVAPGVNVVIPLRFH